MISHCTAPPVFSQQHCTIIVVTLTLVVYVCFHHIVIACMGLLSVIHNDPGVLVKYAVMGSQQAQPAEQETLQSSSGDLVYTTYKTTTLDRAGKLVISPDKVPEPLEVTVMVTGSATSTSGNERERLAKEGRLEQQPSLADLQQFVEIDQSDREELPKFDPVQESSAYSHEMPPSARGLLPPSDGDPSPLPVGTGLDN